MDKENLAYGKPNYVKTCIFAYIFSRENWENMRFGRWGALEGVGRAEWMMDMSKIHCIHK